ncbi:MAG: DUF1800 family protein [Pseudomonadota bacterium]
MMIKSKSPLESPVSRQLSLAALQARPYLSKRPAKPLVAALALGLVACGGSGGGDGGAPPPPVTAPPTSTPAPISGPFSTEQGTARFLTQATFGPTPGQISGLTGTSAVDWFVSQVEMQPTLSTPQLETFEARSRPTDEGRPELERAAPTFVFWGNAVTAPDQLRQRMAFALSQIFVVSDFSGDVLFDIPESLIGYQDILIGDAFGNYRDLLEDVTYSPTMGEYLTYIGNQRADGSGRVPDENYAREILQLFTIGLVELEPNGEPRLVGGAEVETYTNEDITNLARVFTGLDLEGLNRDVFPSTIDIVTSDAGLENNFLRPMAFNDALHSEREKRFLNCFIPANTATVASIDQALDCIMEHPNVGPFVGRQLIQRFTTSDPDPAYVQRVASVFDAGRYTLPDGRVIGDGRKGDLAATLAAILFDEAARRDGDLSEATFGKIREPILRFTSWARAFGVDGSRPEFARELFDTSGADSLSQHPFRARSVFNYYRPGFVAPGTLTGARDLTLPEYQLINASANTGYINFMTFWAFGGLDNFDIEEVEQELSFFDIPVDRTALARAWRPDYTEEIAIADDTSALVTSLNRKLTYGNLSPETASAIEGAISQIALASADDTPARETRVRLATLLVLTSPDFLVQR